MIIIALAAFGIMAAGLVASLNEAADERQAAQNATDEEIEAYWASQDD